MVGKGEQEGAGLAPPPLHGAAWQCGNLNVNPYQQNQRGNRGGGGRFSGNGEKPWGVQETLVET